MKILRILSILVIATMLFSAVSSVFAEQRETVQVRCGYYSTGPVSQADFMDFCIHPLPYSRCHVGTEWFVAGADALGNLYFEGGCTMDAYRLTIYIDWVRHPQGGLVWGNIDIEIDGQLRRVEPRDLFEYCVGEDPLVAPSTLVGVPIDQIGEDYPVEIFCPEFPPTGIPVVQTPVVPTNPGYNSGTGAELGGSNFQDPSVVENGDCHALYAGDGAIGNHRWAAVCIALDLSHFLIEYGIGTDVRQERINIEDIGQPGDNLVEWEDVCLSFDNLVEHTPNTIELQLTVGCFEPVQAVIVQLNPNGTGLLRIYNP